MLPENRIPTHPGEILLEEFLKPLEVSQVAFARHIGVPTQRINEIVRGKRGVTPESAWLFAQAFGTSPQFWMNLQTAYDLARTRLSLTGKVVISSLIPVREQAGIRALRGKLQGENDLMAVREDTPDDYR
jgi:addiction module HigA family antidote